MKNDQGTAQTIAAIATAIGQGGVGIVRLSGSDAYNIGCLMSKRQVLVARHAHFARIYDANGDIIDEVVLLYFKAPHSFTGEDVVEIQGHGGMVLLNLILARAFELGARQANAGEFSYRAFMNDKLDLMQAEAISDAINANSEAQARSAVRSLSGEFSNKINELNKKITNIRLYVEAAIDFSDEEDVDFLGDGVIAARIDEILTQLNQILALASQGVLLKNGIQVVLAGRPNAGKSSLLNSLAGIERAIVTDVAGTTRDTLQESLTLRGLSIHLIDTAGLRDTDDVVEKIGIERTHQAVQQADVLLLVYDLTTNESPISLVSTLFGEVDTKNLLLVGNKVDLTTAPVGRHDVDGIGAVNVSCETKAGVEDLIDALCDKVGFVPNENGLMARTRHVDALKRVYAHCQQAYDMLCVHQAGELAAESLRLAQLDLSELTGEFSSDDLLGLIFSSFCIGK